MNFHIRRDTTAPVRPIPSQNIPVMTAETEMPPGVTTPRCVTATVAIAASPALSTARSPVLRCPAKHVRSRRSRDQ